MSCQQFVSGFRQVVERAIFTQFYKVMHSDRAEGPVLLNPNRRQNVCEGRASFAALLQWAEVVSKKQSLQVVDFCFYCKGRWSINANDCYPRTLDPTLISCLNPSTNTRVHRRLWDTSTYLLYAAVV